MLFTSYEFLVFGAVLLLVYYLIPKKYQWMLLLVAGLLFYAMAGPKCLIYLAFVAACAFLTARRMGKSLVVDARVLEEHRDDWSREERKVFRKRGKKRRMRWLLLGLFCDLGLLAVLKYTGFAFSGIGSFLHIFGVDRTFTVPDLLLPMGLSFYTFQTVSYLIDVYREKTQPQENPFKFLLFVSYFPQMIQGPISRYNDLGPQLTEGHDFSAKNLRWGLERVLFGYFKKLVVADRVLIPIRTMLEEPTSYPGVYVLLLIVLYTVQIYADFTGGMDITIGLSEAMGIRLTENFNRPFLSKSTKEYWNRWHITMGAWFTDYVFYPLSVSAPMQKLSKWGRAHLGNALGKRLPVYFSTIVTWFLTGLWHGAGWNFIVWGLLHCLIILVSQEFAPLYTHFRKACPRLVESRPYNGFCVARTLFLMGLIRSLDCYRNVPLTFRLWGSMFTTGNYGKLFDGSLLLPGLGAAGREMAVQVELSHWILLIAATVLMFALSLWGAREPVRQKMDRRPNLAMIGVVFMLLAVLVFGAYGIGFDANQFIYNQF